MEQHSLDHDDGIDGFSCERTFMVRPRKQVLGGAPAMVMAQIHKDKNIFTLQVRARCLLPTALHVQHTGPLQLLIVCLLFVGTPTWRMTALSSGDAAFVPQRTSSMLIYTQPWPRIVLDPNSAASKWQGRCIRSWQLAVESANGWIPSSAGG